MDFTARDVRTGFFVFLSLAILIVGLYLAGGAVGSLGEKSTYYVHFSNPGLLSPRTRVTYAGTDAGQVTLIQRLPEVDPEGAAARITIQIDSRIQLHEGANVLVRTDGLIGEKFLDIWPGTGKVLPPGAILRGKLGGLGGVLEQAGELVRMLRETLGQVQVLAGRVDGTAVQMDELLGKVDLLVGDNRQNLGQAVSDLGEVLGHIDAILEENREALRGSIGGLQARMEQTGPVLQEFTSLLEQTRKDLARTWPAIEGVVTKLDSLVSDADSLLASADPKLLETLDHIRVATRELVETVRLVKANPSVILWGTSEKDRIEAERSSLPASEDRSWMGPRDEEP